MSIQLIRDLISPQAFNELSKLDKEKQDKLASQLVINSKKKGTGLILAVFGFHYIYLQKWGLFAAYALTGAGLGIWWLIDLFRVNGMIRKENDNQLYRLMSV
jgi:hypothetical protein